MKKNKKLRLIIFLPLAGLIACASPQRASLEEELFLLKPSNLTVDRALETEVVIRFAPPAGLTVSELNFRLDGGEWQPRQETDWHLKTEDLVLGKHLVDMKARANGNKRLKGEIGISVIESVSGGFSLGSDSPRASITLVI